MYQDDSVEEVTTQQVHSEQPRRKVAPVKKPQSAGKSRLDTDRGSANRIIPMDEEKVVEHDEALKDF